MTTPERLQYVGSVRSRRKRWTRPRRAGLLKRVGYYSLVTGYIAALLLPGGILLLPAIVWWHRRRLAARTAQAGEFAPPLQLAARAREAERSRRSADASSGPPERRGAR